MHMFVCASVCEFWGQNFVKGGECKTREKIQVFSKQKKNGKTVISIGDHKFSRSRMTKLT